MKKSKPNKKSLRNSSASVNSLLKRKPPKITTWLLQKLIDSSVRDQAMGDFDEQFSNNVDKKGLFTAKILYWMQIFIVLPQHLKNSIHWGMAMFKNYLKITMRNIKRQKLYSLINLIGLAIGMFVCILIFLYVKDELSYDKFHEKADRIYRISGDNNIIMTGPLAPLLKSELPEIEDYVRLYAPHIWSGISLVSSIDKQFYSERFYFADPSFFDIFTFPFLSGNPQNALKDVNSIVLTENMAKKYFGDTDPVGNTLIYENKYEYRITGVVKNIPSNSHFHFDFLIPLENYRKFDPDLDNWGNAAFITYLLLKQNVNKTDVEKGIIKITEKDKRLPFGGKISLMAVENIHLLSRARNELEVNSSIVYIYIFSAVAILVLLIACLNFINLSTARSFKRFKEIGVRKVVGAQRKQLIKQFLGESIFMSLISFAFAVVLVYMLLPLFNNISFKQISFSIIDNAENFFLLAGLAIFIGILAGSYPAFYFSSFRTVYSLSEKYKKEKHSKVSFRNVLVVFQFIISIGLIAFTGIIHEQMDYLNNKNLGFNKEQIIVIPTHRGETAVKYAPILKQELLKIPEIMYTTVSSQVPGIRPYMRTFKKYTNDKEFRIIETLWVDYDFINAYRMEIIAGRDFSKNLDNPTSSSSIINETGVKMLGYTSPQEIIGKNLTTDGENKHFVGVVKDFHFRSLHNKINPLIIHLSSKKNLFISAAVNTKNISSTLKSIEKNWKEIFPNRPFDFFFLDDSYSKQYQFEQRMGVFMGYFTFLAIFTASLGLFGLSAFTAEQRTKEIGIRKVFGASVKNIIVMVSKYFLYLIAAANIIALPAAYYFANEWIQRFAYRITLGLKIFILSAILALIIALVTVSFQSIKAATTNPVNSLRDE